MRWEKSGNEREEMECEERGKEREGVGKVGEETEWDERGKRREREGRRREVGK